MKHNDANYRLCRSFFVRLSLPVLTALLFLGIVFPGTKAEAATTQEVTTGSDGWGWVTWATPGTEDDADSEYVYRCMNRETGEYLAGGWYMVDNCWFYFTSTGFVRDDYRGGYQIMDAQGKGLYTSESEPEPYKWVEGEDGWTYVNEAEESMLRDCKVWIDSYLYIFDQDGNLPDKGWYYDEEDDDWYYILPSGACATGWKEIGSRWYFFDFISGEMAEAGGYDTRAPFARKEKNCVFMKNGSLRTLEGWVQDADGDWFYANENGSAADGWKTIGNKEYYFESALQGQMAASTDFEWYQDGSYLSPVGTRIGSTYLWHKCDDMWWFGNGRYYVADKTVCINGWLYSFNSKGYCMHGYSLATGEEVVYKTEGRSYTEEELYMIAAVVYCEVGNQSYECQLACANVILNRVDMDAYPDTIEEVIYQKSQFTVVGSAKFERALTTGGSETALAAAKDALEGNNNVPGCIGFRLASGVDPNDSKYIIFGAVAYF